MIDPIELRRIYANIATLLDQGLFPGAAASVIDEARGLIQSVINEMDAANDQEAE